MAEPARGKLFPTFEAIRNIVRRLVAHLDSQSGSAGRKRCPSCRGITADQRKRCPGCEYLFGHQSQVAAAKARRADWIAGSLGAVAGLIGAPALMYFMITTLRSDYSAERTPTTQEFFERGLFNGMSELNVLDVTGPPDVSKEFDRSKPDTQGDIWYFDRKFGRERLTFENNHLLKFELVPPTGGHKL
jgi:hypothetical protein